jgi:hypothetical protein
MDVATPSSVLRELYEALERLDASQRSAASRSRPVIDLRDTVVGADTLRHSVRTRIGADWDLTDRRW